MNCIICNKDTKKLEQCDYCGIKMCKSCNDDSKCRERNEREIQKRKQIKYSDSSELSDSIKYSDSSEYTKPVLTNGLLVSNSQV